MKKLTKNLLIVLGLFPAISFAANTPWQGFYANVGAGLLNTNINSSQQTAVNLPLVVNLSLGSNPNSSNYGGIGSLGVGYSYLVNPSVVLSAELDATLQNSSTTNTTLLSESNSGVSFYNTATTKLRNSFAFLIKPGYLINQQNTLIYALIGPSIGNFATSTSTNFVLNAAAATGTASNSSSGYQLGLTLGLGIQQYISNGFSIGLEYQYTNYGSISGPNSSGPVTSGAGPGTVSNTFSKIKAQTNSLLLNLTYHF